MAETMTKTGFELVDYQPAHAIEILAGGATEPKLELNDQTIEWANIMGDKGPCATGVFDGRPVSCGGIWILWPGVGEQWALNIHDIGDYHIDPAIAKDWMYEKIDEYKLWRLHTPIRSDFPSAVLYTEWLGFKFETRLGNYHSDGSDALMYKIITEKYLPETEGD